MKCAWAPNCTSEALFSTQHQNLVGDAFGEDLFCNPTALYRFFWHDLNDRAGLVLLNRIRTCFSRFPRAPRAIISHNRS